MFRLLLLLALFSVERSRADVTNRQILPIGERQAFMGNAGTGNPRDSGAVYYNPGGLSELGADRVSVLGSAYVATTRKADGLLHLDGTDLPYRSDGFSTIPITFVAAKRTGDWVYAFSTLVPDSLSIDQRANFDSSATHGAIIQSLQRNDLWIGLTASRKLPDERWGVGVTLFGIQHSETDLVQAVLDRIGSTDFITKTDRVESAARGLSLIAGVAFRPNREWAFGLRVQSPFLQLSGGADIYSVTRSRTVAPTTIDQTNAQSKYRLPVDFTLGSSFQATDKLELLFDASFQTPIHYDTLPDSAFSTRISTVFTPRFNLGAEYRLSEKWITRAGVFYNPSAVEELDTVGFQQKENFIGGTLGLSIQIEHVQTGAGLFYTSSSGQNISTGDRNARFDLSTRSIGVLITTAYMF